MTVSAFPRGLIVSCQAYEGYALHGATYMAAMARAADMGGAAGIRANGISDIVAIRAATALPIVGIHKIEVADPMTSVYITPDIASVRGIARAGCIAIALDGSQRARRSGETLRQLIDFIHTGLHQQVMADCSCLSDAYYAHACGADVLATTLAGYTEHGRPQTAGPDFEFLAQLILAFPNVPVVAEGRFETPEQVHRAFAIGAHAVVVGTAITRPEMIVKRFAQRG